MTGEECTKALLEFTEGLVQSDDDIPALLAGLGVIVGNWCSVTTNPLVALECVGVIAQGALIRSPHSPPRLRN